MTDVPESRPPERRRYVPRHVRSALEREREWPTRVGRLWGAVLFVHFFWPVAYIPGWGRFGGTASAKWIFAWDALDQAEGIGALFVFSPLVVGFVTLLASRHATRRAQGVVYLLGGLACILIALGGRESRDVILRSAARGDAQVVIGLLFLLGPILLAAGNHVQRREAGRSLPAVLAGIGGLGLAAAWFIPVRGDTMIGTLFSGPALKEAWAVAIWSLVVIVTGLLGACHLLPGFDAAKLGRSISRLLRIALYVLPIGLVITLLGAGGAFMSGFVSLVWTLSRIYAILILAAAGLAIVLRGPVPELDPEWERAF